MCIRDSHWKWVYRQYPWGLWGHEYIYTASISSHLWSDTTEKHCSQLGLPEREDIVIVAKSISQVSQVKWFVSATHNVCTGYFWFDGTRQSAFSQNSDVMSKFWPYCRAQHVQFRRKHSTSSKKQKFKKLFARNFFTNSFRCTDASQSLHTP